MSHARFISIAAATLIVAMPLLYALSVGPLVYLRSTERPLLSDEKFALIYYPLIRAEARLPPLAHLMHYYVSWWEHPRSKQPEAPTPAARPT